MSNIITTETAVVWSNSSSVYVFHPLTEAFRCPNISGVRASVELETVVDDTEMVTRAYYQVSQDGVTWGATDDLGNALSGSGVSYGSDFEGLGSHNQQWVRFGVKLKNTSTNDLNLGYATLRLEIKHC